MFGPYQVIGELALTAHGSVLRARRIGDEPALFAIKNFNRPTADEAQEPQWESTVFLDRARLQQQLVASGAIHWTSVYQFGVGDGGAWFVTDYLPLSAQKLIDARINLTSGQLYRIVGAIVEGLAELRAAHNRPHSNLKASNVLFAGKDLDKVRILIADLGSSAQAITGGETGDALALGQIIHGLVTHETSTDAETWTRQDDAPWDKLGAPGSLWRQLCQDLLTPVPSLRLPLTSVPKRLEELAPPKRFPVRRLAFAATVPIVILLGAFIALCWADRSARRQFCHDREQWFGAFAAAIEDPSLRARISSDADLKTALDELDRDHVGSLACQPRLFLSATPADWKRFRGANVQLRRLQTQLSPQVWPRLVRAVTLKNHLEDLSWPQPAEYVGTLIDGARIAPGVDTAVGIDRLLQILPLIEQKLPAAEADWKRLTARTKEINSKNDKLLTSFSDGLRRSAAAAVQVSDAGFFRLDEVRENTDLAEQLADAVRSAWPDDIDRFRLASDVAVGIDTDHLRPHDVREFIDLIALNTIRRDEAALAAASLRKQLEETSSLVVHSHPDPSETIQFELEKADVDSRILKFEHAPFTRRIIDDGSFSVRAAEMRARIDALRKYYRADGPQDWLKTLPTLVTSSDRINAYWEAWQGVLRDDVTLAEMARDRQVFARYRDRANQLRILLAALDHGFPPIPEGLSESFTKAARARRERELERLLPLIDAESITLDPAKIKSISDGYTAWSANLDGLARDFPIVQELLTLEDRPDLKWSPKAGFWKEPEIQALVKADVDRINHLQLLHQRDRAKLLMTASDSRVPEVALAAWQILGEPDTRPGWPARQGELLLELGLRQRLATLLDGLRASPQRQWARTELSRQDSIRWKRFVESATSDVMIEEAIKCRTLAVKGDEVAALAPAARYNFWTYLLYQGVSRNVESQVRDALGNVRVAVDDMKGRSEIAGVRARLVQLEIPEAFANLNPGDTVRIPIQGASPALEFRRVDPSDARPFYLQTTEVSFAQFISVVQAKKAWPEFKKLPWQSKSAEHDTRRGPRVWEWTTQGTLPISNPQYWLTPEDDNDFPQALRASRFNRKVLAGLFGGPPEPTHPMQQISVQAALLYAGVCGCRLPTPREWQAAYERFEKATPKEKWNLRDQTWAKQHDYLTTVPGNHWADDGIFHPLPDPSPVGRSATSLAISDGTLYFRHADTSPGAATFLNLVGNVAEFACDTPIRFENWPDRNTAGGIQQFVKKTPECLFVIGGSALSPPELPIDMPLPVERPGEGYADVGLRLAFTAPARTVAERIKWVLGEPHYLWPAPGTDAAVKPK